MAEPDIQLRDANLDDVIGIVYVEATTTIDAYQNTDYGVGEADVRSIDFHAKVPQWQHTLQSPNYKIWVQARGEEILAFLAARKDSESQEVYTQFVLPEYQRQGLGSHLLEVATIWFDKAHPIRLRMVSYLGKAADFYKKHGFRVDPVANVEFLRFPSGKSVPTIEMTTGEIDETNLLDLEKTAPLRVIPRLQPKLSKPTVPIRHPPEVRVARENIGRAELAHISGVRASTIKHYTEIGILPYEQKEARLARRYKKEKALQRLSEIQGLKDQGFKIAEIVQKLSK